MAKTKQSDAAAQTAATTSDLESLAVQLDALAAEAKNLGEEPLHKSITAAAKRARNADKRRAVRVKKFGTLIQQLKAKGLSAEEIIEHQSSENGEGGA